MRCGAGAHLVDRARGGDLPPSSPPSGWVDEPVGLGRGRSRSCSITSTVWPASASRCSTWMSFSTSAMCSPTGRLVDTWGVLFRFEGWRGMRELAADLGEPR